MARKTKSGVHKTDDERAAELEAEHKGERTSARILEPIPSGPSGGIGNLRIVGEGSIPPARNDAPGTERFVTGPKPVDEVEKVVQQVMSQNDKMRALVAQRIRIKALELKLGNAVAKHRKAKDRLDTATQELFDILDDRLTPKLPFPEDVEDEDDDDDRDVDSEVRGMPGRARRGRGKGSSS